MTSDTCMLDTYLISDDLYEFEDHLILDNQQDSYRPTTVQPPENTTDTSSTLVVSTPRRQPPPVPPPFPTPLKLQPVEQVLQDNPGTGASNTCY